MSKPCQHPGYLLVIPWGLEGVGGVSQVVINLYRELGHLGWEPGVLVCTWEAVDPQFDNSGQIPVLRWRIRSPLYAETVVKSLLGFGITLAGLARRWRQLARRHDWRVVNVHYPDTWALTWVMLRNLGIWRGVVVISLHGRDVRDALHHRGMLVRRLMRYLLEQADVVVACSAELVDEATQLAPRAIDHLRVVPNGVNPEALMSELSQNPCLPDELQGHRFILNVATFEYKKSQDVLIDAFVRVAAEHKDVQLVLVGRSTPWLSEVRRIASASGVSDRVHIFVDLPHKQIPALLAQASVFCLPSRAEGHPLAIMEAAVFGLPVVATPVGGIPQTIRDDKHGLLVPVGDAATLARALSRLLRHPDLAGEIGQNLKRVVESEFTWTETARQYTALTRSVSGNVNR